jgi:hypothetical protein
MVDAVKNPMIATPQLINWAVGSIGVLTAALGYMISHYIIK